LKTFKFRNLRKGEYLFYALPFSTGFGLTPSYFLFACAKEKVTKEKAHPASGSGYARLPSLHHRSRGTPRRAIPGPSRLSRHPGRSTPSTTIRSAFWEGAFSGCSNFLRPAHHHVVCTDFRRMGRAERNPCGGGGTNPWAPGNGRA